MRADELVSEVVVIERAQIEDSAARTVPELLARSAGVQFTSTGGVGKVAGVFIRGAESRHTVLLAFTGADAVAAGEQLIAALPSSERSGSVVLTGRPAPS